MVWENRRRRNIFDLFNDFFDSIFSDFEDDADLIERPQPRRNVKGFSVRIRQVPGQEPKVEVQRFEPEGVKEVQTKKVEVVGEKPSIQLMEDEKLPEKPVKFEQPEVAEGSDPKGKFVDITMPGIKNVKQVKLNILEQSIEVKAISNEEGKGYFWIVKIPTGSKKVTKVWKEGKFRLYFS
jgi:hypothetical protein